MLPKEMLSCPICNRFRQRVPVSIDTSSCYINRRKELISTNTKSIQCKLTIQINLMNRDNRKIVICYINQSSHRNDLNKRTFSTLDFYKKHQDVLTPGGLAFFQADYDSSLIDFYHNVLSELWRNWWHHRARATIGTNFKLIFRHQRAQIRVRFPRAIPMWRRVLPTEKGI